MNAMDTTAPRTGAGRRRCRDDRGDTMVMTTILIGFLLISSWALVSGVEQWGARRDIQAAASAAARAGAQPSPDEVRNGSGSVLLDLDEVRQRANSVLAASGYTGDIQVIGTEVVVVVSGGVSYSFPAPGFPSSLPATGRAEAISGVTAAGA